MRRWAPWIVAVLGLSAVIHVVTVMAVPYVIVFVVGLRGNTEPNHVHHGPLITSETRDVVRPSPDLLYSACPFDVGRRPLRITAKVPDSYFSISAFSANTDNFFVINDQQIDGDSVEVVIVSEDAPYARRGSEIVARAPEDLGVVLFRTLVPDRSKAGQALDLQQHIDCRLLE
jgi:uncharacterized membrane protein